MFWVGWTVTLIASLLGIGLARSKVSQRYPRIAEYHMDVILIVLVIIGLGLSGWDKIVTDRENAELRQMASPPTLSLYSTDITRTANGYQLKIRLKCDKNTPLGQLQFLAAIPPESQSQILEFWPSGEAGAFQSGPDSKKISTDGRQARLIYSLMAAGHPSLDLEVTLPTTVTLKGNYLPSNVVVSVK